MRKFKFSSRKNRGKIYGICKKKICPDCQYRLLSLVETQCVKFKGKTNKKKKHQGLYATCANFSRIKEGKHPKKMPPIEE